MKKLMISLAVFATALFAVSCQKESAEGNAPAGEASDLVEASLTASFEATKVSYTETAGLDLQPKWEIGDEVLAIDNSSRNYSLTVSDVSEDGKIATLVGSIPANGALHMMYKYGGHVILGSVDYSLQSGDKRMPAMAFAEGTVVNGTGVFSFTNPGAVIGITNAVGVPAGTAISKVVVKGVGLSEGLVTLENGYLNLAAVRHESLYKIYYLDDATDFQIDKIEVYPQTNIVVNEDSSLSEPIFIAVPSGATVSFVSIYGDSNAPFTLNVGRDLYAGEYAYVKTQSFAPNKVQLWKDGPFWATCNIGGDCPADYGWYFSWGNVEPFIPVNVVMQGDGNYVRDVYSIYSGITYERGQGLPEYSSTPGSNLTTNIPVDSQYDAAQAYWGGKWRIPTGSELKAFTQNVTCQHVENYCGTGINGNMFNGIGAYSSQSIFVPMSSDLGYNMFQYWTIMRASDCFVNEHAPVEYQYPNPYYFMPVWRHFYEDDPYLSSDSVFPHYTAQSSIEWGPLSNSKSSYIPIRPVCDMDVSGGLSKYNGSAL